MATSTDEGAFARLDRTKFFAALKPMFGSYTQAQVDGLNHLLDVFLAYALVLDRRLLAYIIATSFHRRGAGCSRSARASRPRMPAPARRWRSCSPAARSAGTMRCRTPRG